MSDSKSAAVAASLAGGYLLGRGKGGKAALGVAIYLATRKMQGGPKQEEPEEETSSKPSALQRLTKSVRGELMEAGRSAVKSAANNKLDAFVENLEARTRELSQGDRESGGEGADRQGRGSRRDDDEEGEERGEGRDEGQGADRGDERGGDQRDEQDDGRDGDREDEHGDQHGDQRREDRDDGRDGEQSEDRRDEQHDGEREERGGDRDDGRREGRGSDRREERPARGGSRDGAPRRRSEGGARRREESRGQASERLRTRPTKPTPPTPPSPGPGEGPGGRRGEPREKAASDR